MGNQRDILKKMQQEIVCLPGESIYGPLFLRKLSLYLTPSLAKTKLTPNMITILSILFGILGAASLMLNGLNWYILGLGSVLMWIFLDTVDGDLARLKSMQSLKGIYIDTLGHYVINPLIFASMSVYLAQQVSPYLTAFGFVSFIFHQFSRLAKDVPCSILYHQINKHADPKHAINADTCRPYLDSRQVLHPILKMFVAYILDAVSITLIWGMLRLMINYNMLYVSLAAYFLFNCAVIGGSAIHIYLGYKNL